MRQIIRDLFHFFATGLALSLAVALFASQALASEISPFELSTCRGAVCIKAEAARGFISSSGELVAGSRLILHSQRTQASATAIDCASFTYNLNQQTLICRSSDETRVRSFDLKSEKDLALLQF